MVTNMKKQFHLFLYNAANPNGGCSDYIGNFDDFWMVEEYAKRRLAKSVLYTTYEIAVEDDLTGRLTVIQNG